MGSVRTSILRRPRPLPPHRRADHPEVSSYTLDWEEPFNRQGGSIMLHAVVGLTRSDAYCDLAPSSVMGSVFG